MPVAFSCLAKSARSLALTLADDGQVVRAQRGLARGFVLDRVDGCLNGQLGAVEHGSARVRLGAGHARWIELARLSRASGCLRTKPRAGPLRTVRQPV